MKKVCDFLFMNLSLIGQNQNVPQNKNYLQFGSFLNQKIDEQFFIFHHNSDQISSETQFIHAVVLNQIAQTLVSKNINNDITFADVEEAIALSLDYLFKQNKSDIQMILEKPKIQTDNFQIFTRLFEHLQNLIGQKNEIIQEILKSWTVLSQNQATSKFTKQEKFNQIPSKILFVIQQNQKLIPEKNLLNQSIQNSFQSSSRNDKDQQPHIEQIEINYHSNHILFQQINQAVNTRIQMVNSNLPQEIYEIIQLFQKENEKTVEQRLLIAQFEGIIKNLKEEAHLKVIEIAKLNQRFTEQEIMIKQITIQRDESLTANQQFKSEQENNKVEHLAKLEKDWAQWAREYQAKKKQIELILSNEIQDYKQENDQQKAQIKIIENKISILNKQIEEEKNTFDKEITLKKQEMMNQQQQIGQYQAQIAQLEKIVQEKVIMVIEKDRNLFEIKESWKTQVTQLMQDNEKKQQEMQDRLKKSIEGKDHQISSLKTAHLNEINKQEKQNAEQIKSLQSTHNIELNKQEQQKDEEINQLKLIHNIELKQEKQKVEEIKQIKSIHNLEKQKDEEINQQKVSHRTEFNKQEKYNEEEIKNQKNKFLSEIEILQSNLKIVQKEILEQALSIKDKDQRNSDLLKNYDLEKVRADQFEKDFREGQEEIKNLKGKYLSDMKTLENAKQQEINNLNANYEDKIKSTIEEYEAKVKQILEKKEAEFLTPKGDYQKQQEIEYSSMCQYANNLYKLIEESRSMIQIFLEMNQPQNNQDPNINIFDSLTYSITQLIDELNILLFKSIEEKEKFRELLLQYYECIHDPLKNQSYFCSNCKKLPILENGFNNLCFQCFKHSIFNLY